MITHIDGIDIKCPTCGNEASFNHPRLTCHIKWRNQHGCGVRIFCENCKLYHDVKSMKGTLVSLSTNSVTWKIPSWK